MWDLISTAPKDGSFIIAARFGPDQELKWVRHSRWITAEECASNWGGEPDDYEAGWTEGENEEEACYPTHWMKLTPPQAKP
jgi:hypothetical protein